MKCSLEIRKGSETVLSRELGAGEYAIGRKEGNDIVLADRSISGRHAVITVGKKKVVVADPGSRNGVLFQGKRIKKQSFAKDFSVALGPFVLDFSLGTAAAAAGKKSGRERKTGSKSFVASLNPRLLVYGIVFCFALFMSIAYYAPLKSGLESGRQREALTRGFLLVRYLGAINQLPLEEKRMDVLRTDPSSTEEGVRYAYVVDPYGKVLAPAQEMGKFLKLRKVDKALADPKLRAWDGEDGEQIIFYPIKKMDKLLGAAIIGYDLKRAAAIQGGGIGATAALLFMVSLVVAGICGFLILRGFLSPLRALAEDAGVCLKQRQDHVTFQATYAELRTLVETINRMLLQLVKMDNGSVTSNQPEEPQSAYKAEMETTATETKMEPDLPQEATGKAIVPPDPDATFISDVPPEPASSQPIPSAPELHPQYPVESRPRSEAEPSPVAELSPSNTEPQPTPRGGDLDATELPACHIDLQQYTIAAFNSGFCDFFAGGEKKQGMHMLEAFPDPELISVISGLIDNEQPAAEAVAAGERTITVRKTALPENDGLALFTFQESSHG